MSGIIPKLKHFIKNLKGFTFPSEVKNEIERLHDLLARSELRTLIKNAIRDKENDFDISFAELLALHRNGNMAFYNESLQKVVHDLVSYCNSALEERNTLLQNLLDFIYNCKVVTDSSLIDTSKVNPKIFPICKTLFKNEALHKTEEIISFIHATDIGILYALLYKSTLFSQTQFLTLTTQQQQNVEKKATELSTARKGLVLKQAESRAITPSLNVKIAALSREGYIVAASAPTSPMKMNVEVPGARSRSVPNSAKAQRATERHLGQVFVTTAPPTFQDRHRSSSDSIVRTPEVLSRREGTVASTSSTLLEQATDQLPDLFFKLALGPSSKSEDESEELRLRALKDKEKKDGKGEKRHHKH